MVIITVPLTTGSTPTPFCQVGENKNEKKISAFKSYSQRAIPAWCKEVHCDHMGTGVVTRDIQCLL